MAKPTPPGASQPPPPPTSGNALKFAVVGLILLGTAAGLWLYLSSKNAPPPTPPAKPPEVARVNPMEQQQLDLEEPEPEPPPAAGGEAPAPVKQPRKASSGNEWECSGDLPGAKKVIDSNYAQIRSCYERRLKVNNILQGDVKLKLKVGAGGKVVAASVSGTINDKEVFNCMRSLAQSWTFTAPTGGACAVVQVPFAFAPKDG